MGLVNRLVVPGEALGAAVKLGAAIAAHPQRCVRSDRLSSYEQWNQASLRDALLNELERGRYALEAPSLQASIQSFVDRIESPAASSE